MAAKEKTWSKMPGGIHLRGARLSGVGITDDIKIYLDVNVEAKKIKNTDAVIVEIFCKRSTKNFSYQ